MGISTVGSSWFDSEAIRERYGTLSASNSGGLTKDDLEQLRITLLSNGKSTSNIDKLIDNWDDIDTDGDGQITSQDVKKFNASEAASTDETTEATETASESSNTTESSSNTLSKEQLIALKDKLESAGTTVPTGLESLIENFDEVDSDGDGMITGAQFAEYASDNEISFTTATGSSSTTLISKLLQSYTSSTGTSLSDYISLLSNIQV